MRAAFSAYSPKSAAGLCACSRKNSGAQTTADITGAAGIAQRSFFHVFPSKEALLLELVRRMFGGQFDLAGQHSGAADPVFLYAVETALSLSIATAQRKARSLT